MTAEDIARAIAAPLFTGGFGSAVRLKLMGADGRDLGGWCRSSVEAMAAEEVRKALAAQDSLVASLRAANAEQAQVIERLTRPVDAIGKENACSAIVSPRLCAEPACAGATVRRGEASLTVGVGGEQRKTQASGGPCATCVFEMNTTCNNPALPYSGHEFWCEAFGNGCYAHSPRKAQS